MTFQDNNIPCLPLRTFDQVDNSEYPTLSHFLRDIEQIVFNAKEYNPLTLKDVRGRSIVHAAHRSATFIL